MYQSYSKISLSQLIRQYKFQMCYDSVFSFLYPKIENNEFYTPLKIIFHKMLRIQKAAISFLNNPPQEQNTAVPAVISK